MSRTPTAIRELAPSTSTENRARVANLTDLLRQTACSRPNDVGYTFLLNDGAEEVSITYGELDHQARSIGAYLQALNMRGERVLLLYPAGLEYIAAFFGCLYAGAVAVPAYPPRMNRSLARLHSIAVDAQAKLVLTTKPILSRIERLFQQLPELERLKWLMTDGLSRDYARRWREPAINGDTLAFLQYTSGSTSEPKGVMVSHDNVMHNESMIQRVFNQSEHSVIVGWLPFYHDMGLIGNLLQPLYLGARCVLMSPMTFLQRPMMWLEAISRYRATTSGGPNFAYDLCVRKVTAGQRATLDLTSWDVAYSGAEPVRRETMEKFAAAFAECGFRREAFQPCYGLAESTLIVSGGKKSSLPVIKSIDSKSLEQHRVNETEAGRPGSRFVVSCGHSLPEQAVLVVEPTKLTECLPGEIGEVWLAGPSVAGGYWNRPEETAETFNAYLADNGGVSYLRTGDLGFLQDGELFVTGRRKDLIIIRGLNYYPQDIELTVEQSHASLRPGCGAAFADSRYGEERLVIVQETKHRRPEDMDAILEAIRSAVSMEHELNAAAIILTKPGVVPRTSSGKIRRRACRDMFIAGELEILAAWQDGALTEAPGATTPAPLPNPDDGAEAVENWIVSLLAARLKLDVSQIEPSRSLGCYGLDSLTAIDLAHQVESRLGVNLPMAAFLEGPTVSELAVRVVEQLAQRSGEEEQLTANQEPVSECSLSNGQKSIWFMQRFAPESTAYHIARAVRVRAELDEQALRRAFQMLTARHGSLRTSFHSAQGEPFQTIHELVETAFQETDASAWSDDYVQGSLAEAAHQPFDLERAPLLRVRLLKRSANDYVLLLTVHHIIADLWSLAVLLEELFKLYEAERTATAVSLPPLGLQYSDYVKWQQEMVAGAEGEKHWAYWQARLKGELPTLNLLTARSRPAFRAYRGGERHLKLSAELTDQLKEFSRAHGATLYMTLLAAFFALLHRYTGQEDLLVGTSVAGRSRPQFVPLIGYFVNPLVLRTDLSGDPHFEELLARVRHGVLAAFEHQDYPFASLVERLQPERAADRAPLFDVMFVLQKSQLEGDAGLTSLVMEEGGAQRLVGNFLVEPVPIERRTVQYDLSLIVAETNDGLLASFEYDAELFDPEMIERLSGHYHNLLAAVAADPGRRVSAMPLLTDEESWKLLTDWNGRESEYPQTPCLHEVFAEQAGRTPGNIAVVFGERQLSYAQLDQQANELANYLRAQGVVSETRVAILLERSLEAIVSIVAILKTGGAYVPLDPDYPDERLAFMLDDSGATVLLTQQSLLERLPATSARVVCLDSESECDALAHQSDTKPSNPTHPENLAYVLYTSGSTGRPKGVCCQHAGVLNLLSDFEHRAPLSAGDNCSLWTSLSFDVSIYEIFSALLSGATLVLVPVDVRSDFESFAEWLSEHRIASAYLPPAMLPEFAGKLSRQTRHYELKRLLVGVEPISETVLATINQQLPSLRIINGYGPTEATICATLYELELPGIENRTVPIGRAVQNSQAYLLDSNFSLVPVGVSGELYLGGAGLARGYYGQAGLTAERFVPDPWTPGGRLYRTGDVARYNGSGELEYLGRLDQQVKLRGYRIELGEIEAVLREDERVVESVVVAVGGVGGEQQLAAYVVGREGPGQDGGAGLVAELRRKLEQRLPHYMVPGWLEVLAELPQTPNGKVDRRALPAPGGRAGGLAGGEERALTAVEEVVAGVWCEVLAVNRVGAEEDFFALGGHSLLATRVVSRLREIFNVEVPLRTLFSNPTVAGVALSIERARQNGSTPLQARIQPAKREAFRVQETVTGRIVIPEAVKQRL